MIMTQNQFLAAMIVLIVFCVIASTKSSQVNHVLAFL